MEEIDFCWRARHLGYKASIAPGSVVFHVGGGTLNYNNPLKVYLNFRNNLYLLFKNLPGKQLATILPARMVLDGMAAFVFLLKGEFGSFGRVFSAHMKFYRYLPQLMNKRRIIFETSKNSSPTMMSKQSILWNYFVLKRRKFSEIK
jgi:GT2 family glycosyltransferase